MKKLIVFIFICTALSVTAQKKLPLLKKNSAIKADVEKVTRDYYDHFYNIKGDKIVETESTIEYQSKIIPEGVTESTITQIKSLHNVYSWEATMLHSEDYEKAVEKYKEIFRALNGASFVMHDNKAWKFKGDYDAPDDGRAFASSILEPDVNEKALKRLKVEVALNYNMPEWTVKILVYEKQSDEDIRPSESTSFNYRLLDSLSKSNLF